MELIGRDSESSLLKETVYSSRAEMVVVYGRRHVGKTFLIRKVCEKEMAFSFTGLHHGELYEQLENFAISLSKETKSKLLVSTPTNWIEAFRMLETYLTPLVKRAPKVVFIDEFPWLDTHKSGFLTAFENFWNGWGAHQPNLKLVLCGSAASWMIKKIINNKGGLHNRITRKIRLLPFNLNETEAFLRAKKVTLDRYQITTLYMAMGGIPHYLNEIKAGQSAVQNIDRICFEKDGLLQDEFKNLYNALFDNADRHIAIIKVLADKPKGLNRKDIIAFCGFVSGGTVSELLEELLESGFISSYTPFNNKVKDTVYKLADEYSAFYLKYIKKTRTNGKGTWLKLSTMPSWKSWSGFAFESVCLKHTNQIKQALGISGIYTEESLWRSSGNKEIDGAQIDLLIDRNDSCISICELKFSTIEFVLDKKYLAELQTKTQAFASHTKTRKSLLGVFITTYGVKNNEYKDSWVQNEVKLDQLFRASSV